jgi:ferrochelatase
MAYFGRPDFQHDQPELDAVLLVNLGTPAKPTTGDVRRYLAEFLADPRVIELPRWLWRLILHGVILRIRPARSAHAYQQVWTEAGSPLLALSEKLRGAVATRLDAGGQRPIAVGLAMRYGKPSIADTLRALAARNLRRLLVLPLYPQYSATTTASVFDAIAHELSHWRQLPELRFVTDYWAEPAYLDALAESVRRAEAERGRAEHLLFSFHGIPHRYFRAGDPYHCQCHGTARAVAERLGREPASYTVAFQSRVGREEWLRPYTDETIAALPARGVRSLAVICPGFAVDCLETLEEIAMQNRDSFLAAGGTRFDYIAALNDAAAHVDALARVIERHTRGWPALDPAWSAEMQAERDRTRAARYRALADRTRP